MTGAGGRGRVLLHSGGISPAEVRLRRRGASEKATAPGRDIRDIGPDKGPTWCRICSKPVGRPRVVHCDACIADKRLVKEVRAELKRLGLPPLGKTVAKSAPMSKKRRRAEAALQRLGMTTKLAHPRPAQQKTVNNSPALTRVRTATAATCPRCFVTLPATGQCDNCA